MPPEPVEPTQNEINADIRVRAKNEPNTVYLDGTGYSVNEAAKQVQFLQQYDMVAGTSKADELNSLYVAKAMEIDEQYPVDVPATFAELKITHIPTMLEIAEMTAVSLLVADGVNIPVEQLSKTTDEKARYGGLTSPANGEEWGVKTYYSSGTTVVFQTKEYECLQSHISQADWTPNIVPALWNEMKAPYAEWQQPQGAHDAYQIDDVVLFEGKTYRCTIANNIYSPAAYPQGWEEII